MILEFKNPEFLWFLLLIPLLAFIQGRKGHGAAILFSSTSIAKKIFSNKRSKIGRILLASRLLAIALFIIAIARPQLGKKESFTKTTGIDIVLALDLSSSMLALDFATPSNLVTRLDVAKSVIDEFIKARPFDRMALIAFAGDSHLVSPLTLNHDWLESSLGRLQIGAVKNDSQTAIGDALAMSVNRLKDLDSKSRVVILLTDGVNNAGRVMPLIAAEAAAAFNTKIYTIMVGKGGIVPSFALDKNGNILRDNYGQPQIGYAESPVDENTLDQIAEITGAKSFKAENAEELKNIYKEIDKLETTSVELNQFSLHHEAFMYPLFLGLCILGVERFLNNTRFRRLP